MPFSTHADALAVGDAGGDLDLDLPLAQRPADPVACRAGRLHGLPEALAARTGAAAQELAEDALRDLLHPSRAAAHVAGDGRRPRRGAVATARLARLRCPHRNADGDAGKGVGERDLGTRRDI